MSYSYAKYSDAQLLHLMGDNNGFAFTEIYNRYWDRLFIVAGNKLEDGYQAQEIVQDIFIDLWERRHTLAVQYSLITYLSAALKYRIINMRNKKAREQNLLGNLRATSDNKSLDTEQVIGFDELQDRLAALVARLPEKCRLVYKLSRDGGYTVREISRELDISEKTVESHLTKALKWLRSGLNSVLFFRTFPFSYIKIKKILNFR